MTTPPEWSFYFKAAADIAQVLAVIGAATYFGWKIISGYAAVNLTVSVTSRRYKKDEDTDLLVMTVTFAKGDREAVVLKEVKLLLTKIGMDIPTKHIEITDPEITDEGRMIRITPGETATFEHVEEVPSEAVIKLIATVSGSVGFLTESVSPTAFWRGSAISVPWDRKALVPV